MTHRIMTVHPKEAYKISAVFQNGVEKEYDIGSLFSVFPQFRELERTSGLFETVKVDVGGYGISWNDELDLDADEIWEDGLTIAVHETDPLTSLAVSLIEARKMQGMSQKQLAEATGIYQADISKMERGLANPSVMTLHRLAQGMNMELHILFREKT